MSHIPPYNAPGQATRREFLKRSAAVSAAAAAATPLALNLAAMGDAAAQTASDYKAIVCIFLNGGNDYANTLVPYDTTTWGAYDALRNDIGYARDRLTATVLKPGTALPGGVQYALPPELAPLLEVFNSKKLAPVLNVGALVEPTTRAQYLNKSVQLPPKLLSHNDQASYWQSSRAEGSISGWGGGIGDAMFSANSKSAFTCIGLGGNAVYLSGSRISQYQVSPTSAGGAIPVRPIVSRLGGSQACSDLLRTIMSNARSANLMEREYANICARSINLQVEVSGALAGVSVNTPFPTEITSTRDGSSKPNPLAPQLKRVAELIAARNALGVKRQVFMVSLGGFDTHSELKTNHADLMLMLGGAMAAFYKATNELGVANNVVSFTASEFGRTLTSNTSGSDHGWGSMHFVMGGSVKGGNYVGTSPQFANGGQDDIGQGRLIPTTSVDQLASTLSSWFGVPETTQLGFLPNLKNFSKRNLGFMA